jgi:hypothetical protein
MLLTTYKIYEHLDVKNSMTISAKSSIRAADKYINDVKGHKPWGKVVFIGVARGVSKFIDTSTNKEYRIRQVH